MTKTSALLAALLWASLDLLALGKADQHIKTAQQLLRRGREKDAALELKAALAVDPGRSDARELLGSLGAEAPQGASPTAAAAAPSVDSGMAARLEGPLARAASAYKDSDLKAAAAAWNEVLQLSPGHAEAGAGLQQIEQEAYRPDADQPFDKAVADLYDEGLREARKGRLVEARRKLDEAKALNPAQPQVLAALSRVTEGARSQQSGRDAESWVLEGQRRLAEGEDAKAAAAFSAALAASPGLRAAEQGLAQVRERNAAKVATAAEQGSAALASQDWGTASQRFELALSLDPAHSVSKQGLEQARARLQSSRSAASQRREADRLYNAGVDAWQAGDLALAAARFREALAVAPQDAEAAKALSAVRKKLEERADKDRLDAARLLEEGRTLESRGALDEALRRYQRALAKDPALAEAAEAQASLEKRLKGL